MDEAQEIAPWRRQLRDHLLTLRGDSETQLNLLASLRHAFQQDLAGAAGPVMTAEVQRRDEGILESRREVCSWVNAQLRTLGLAIRCPRTGQPSILVADARDEHDHRGRFRLEHRDAGGRASRTLASVTPPVLDLMEDPPRREPLARRMGGGGASPGPSR